MKIIDQTPLLDANGRLSLVNRIQGMLTYGFSWPANLESQDKVIAQLNKAIEKGHTLIRNQKLGASEIMVPLILVGPSGIYVIEATSLKGLYRVRGEELGTIASGRFQPASVNVVSRTMRLAKALQMFLERQGLKLTAPVEPVLVAADPGLHIESVRPAVRVVLSDAIGHFAASMVTARPIYNLQDVNDFVERIQNPRSARQAEKPPKPMEDAFTFKEEASSADKSRMQSILHSPQSDRLIETGQSDIDFAFEEEPSPTVLVSNPAPGKGGTRTSAASRKKLFMGMTLQQIGLLLVLGIMEFCVLAGFAAVIFLNQSR